MRSLGTLIPETLKQHNAGPWIWLYRIELEATTLATAVAYLTSHSEPVVHTSYGEGSKTWHPFPVTHEPIEEDSEGNLPQSALTFSNVSREFTRYLQVTDGLVGLPVRIHLVHEATLGTSDELRWDFEVRGAEANNQTATLRLELASFYEITMPQDVFARSRCRWRFKSGECGYSGSLTICNKILVHVDGCTGRGDDMVNNGRPRSHPGRFGGFPSIPRISS